MAKPRPHNHNSTDVMNRIFPYEMSDYLKGDHGSRFRLILMYEEASQGLKALRSFRRVARDLQEEFEFELECWSFKELDRRLDCEMAVRKAANADMVIVSAHAGTGLPDGLKCWFDHFLVKRRNPPHALVEMLDDGRGHLAATGCMHPYLKQVAEDTGMDFFCRETSEVKTGTQVSLKDRERKVGPVLETILGSSHVANRWGLNE